LSTAPLLAPLKASGGTCRSARDRRRRGRTGGSPTSTPRWSTSTTGGPSTKWAAASSCTSRPAARPPAASRCATRTWWRCCAGCGRHQDRHGPGRPPQQPPV